MNINLIFSNNQIFLKKLKRKHRMKKYLKTWKPNISYIILVNFLIYSFI